MRSLKEAERQLHILENKGGTICDACHKEIQGGVYDCRNYWRPLAGNHYCGYMCCETHPWNGKLGGG